MENCYEMYRKSEMDIEKIKKKNKKKNKKQEDKEREE